MKSTSRLLLLCLIVAFVVIPGCGDDFLHEPEGVDGDIMLQDGDDPDGDFADGDIEEQDEESLADGDEEIATEMEIPEGLPDSLDVTYEREDIGDEISDEEITDFTKRLVGYWKKVDFFNWILRISHGVHESTELRDYAVFWSGVDAYKEGDTVRFYHHDPNGGGHNIMIPTPHLLASAISGYLMTGDAKMAKVAELYCKGITATMLGMVYDEDDQLLHLMARNIATVDHSYTTDDGRKKSIDYTGWHTEYVHWNTSRFEYKNNPYWGSVWVTNMRSKDDVPHIYLAVPHLIYAAEFAEDQNVKDACTETLEYMGDFTRDIVDHDYRIRSKDINGEPFEPGYTGDVEADNGAGDLGTFNAWESFIPGAECNAKRTTALIGYDKGLDNNCGTAGSNLYESTASNTHYYNQAIIRFFHVSHLAMALVKRDNQAASELLVGMTERIEGYIEKPSDKVGISEWNNDLALLAMRSAAFGFPLTSYEARLIQDKYLLAIEEFKNWPNYDLWSDSIGEGKQSYRPGHVKTVDEERIDWVRIEDMALLMEYCWSPFKNTAGVRFIDCDIVRDPSQWDATYIADPVDGDVDDEPDVTDDDSTDGDVDVEPDVTDGDTTDGDVDDEPDVTDGDSTDGDVDDEPDVTDGDTTDGDVDDEPDVTDGDATDGDVDDELEATDGDTTDGDVDVEPDVTDGDAV